VLKYWALSLSFFRDNRPRTGTDWKGGEAEFGQRSPIWFLLTGGLIPNSKHEGLNHILLKGVRLGGGGVGEGDSASQKLQVGH